MGQTIHVRHQTLDDHNFLVQSLIRMFLDSMERSLSLESDHMPVKGMLCSCSFLKIGCCTKCTNYLSME